jgi:hypothetical protein
MVYDSDYREVACAAIDTAYTATAQGANTPGAFKVPTTANAITEIRIGLGGISADTVADVASYIHIYGSGVVIGEGYFAGPIAGTAGAAATSGGYNHGKLMVYKTNIPVKGGGEFNVDTFVSGTDAGTAHMFVGVVYDGTPGRIVDGDIREVSLTTANTLVSVVNRAGSAAGNFKPVSAIGEVIVGCALTPTGDATAGLVGAVSAHLSGGGLLAAGNYKFLGNTGWVEPDTDVHGPGVDQALPERYECLIQVKKGSEIEAQAQMLESTQAGNAIVGLCYV